MGEKRVIIEGSLIVNPLTCNKITPEAEQHLILQMQTGKDLEFRLTDKDGARFIGVYDSDGTLVAKIDSNGLITTAAGLAGPVTGAVTGNVTGDLLGNSTGSHTGDVVANDDAAHDYLAGHVDWTLSASEKKAKLLVVTNADAAANIIGPAEKREYILRNASGQAITIKKTGGTGVAVANGKTAIVRYSSSVGDYIRVTADATH